MRETTVSPVREEREKREEGRSIIGVDSARNVTLKKRARDKRGTLSYLAIE